MWPAPKLEDLVARPCWQRPCWQRPWRWKEHLPSAWNLLWALGKRWTSHSWPSVPQFAPTPNSKSALLSINAPVPQGIRLPDRCTGAHRACTAILTERHHDFSVIFQHIINISQLIFAVKISWNRNDVLCCRPVWAPPQAQAPSILWGEATLETGDMPWESKLKLKNDSHTYIYIYIHIWHIYIYIYISHFKRIQMDEQRLAACLRGKNKNH